MNTRQLINIKPERIIKDGFEVYEALADRLELSLDAVLNKPDFNVNHLGGCNIWTYTGNVHQAEQNRGLKTSYGYVPKPTCPEHLENFIKNNGHKIKCLSIGGSGNYEDGFMYIDRKYKTTIEFLNFLARSTEHHNIKKIVISTMSDLVAHDQYIEAFQRLQSIGIEIEIRFLNMKYGEAKRKEMFPGAPSRLRCEKAKEKLNTDLFRTNKLSVI